MRKRQGFTLIELLLVTALMGGIAIAVSNAFGNGLRLWKKADQLTRQTTVGIFLEKFSEDLRQVPLISTLGFKGISMEILFPSVIWVEADPNGSRAKEERIDQIGTVRYRFDPVNSSIYRSQANYGQSLKKIMGNEVMVAEGVTAMEFRYLQQTDKGLESKAMIDEGIPAMVAVKLTVVEGGQPITFERFYEIPVGGAL